MLILVINCGSATLKYQLFDIQPKKSPAVQSVAKDSVISRNHDRDIRLIRDKFWSKKIRGIGHRVVHGGEEFEKASLINKYVLKSIGKKSELAPLHNPPSLAGITACRKYFPGVPQVAVFDTAFHQSIPEEAYIYGIPFHFYKKYKIRRYGFHGTSHRFVAGEASRILKKPLSKLKLITAHLGNGCSMTAVLKGKAIDTSMGFTPLEGLLMGTRGGDLDPAIVTFLMEKEKLSISEIKEILNKKSGLLGISGVSNDMRKILREMKNGNRRAGLSFRIFVYRIKKYIGAYQAAMNGLDAVIFTGGIGENLPGLRQILSRELKGALTGRVKFLTIPTNEELLIAKDTYKVIKGD
jgi:acetate kinase